MSALPIDPTDEQLDWIWTSTPGDVLDALRTAFQAGVEAERARAAAETPHTAEAFQRILDVLGYRVPGYPAIARDVGDVRAVLGEVQS